MHWISLLKMYGIAFATFCLLDFVWLGFVAKDFYRRQLGFLMTDQVNWWAAILFYLLFIAALVYFVIQPAYEKGNVYHAIFAGAFFGLVTYATYDLTNLATLKNWPLLMTCIDLAWGAVLSSAVSFVTFSLLSK